MARARACGISTGARRRIRIAHPSVPHESRYELEYVLADPMQSCNARGTGTGTGTGAAALGLMARCGRPGGLIIIITFWRSDSHAENTRLYPMVVTWL